MSVQQDGKQPSTDESHPEADPALEDTRAEPSAAEQAVANEQQALESGEESPG